MTTILGTALLGVIIVALVLYIKEKQETILIIAAPADADFTRKLKIKLSNQKRNVILEEDFVNIGDEITKKIQNKIDNTRHIIVILSSAFLKSSAAKEFTERIPKENHHVYPVVIEDIDLTALPVHRLQDLKRAYIRFEGDLKDDIHALEKALKENIR